MLAKNLRKFREKKGLWQYELAKKANVPQSAIHYIEAGQRSPTVKTLQKLAAALEVSVNELLEDNVQQLKVG